MGCPSCSRRSNPSRQGMAPSPRVLLLPRLGCWCVVFLLPSAETPGLDASSELKPLWDLETWGSCVWVEPCLKSTVIAFGKWCSVHVLQTTGSRAALRCLSRQAPRALHKQVPEFYNSFILYFFLDVWELTSKWLPHCCTAKVHKFRDRPLGFWIPALFSKAEFGISPLLSGNSPKVPITAGQRCEWSFTPLIILFKVNTWNPQTWEIRRDAVRGERGELFKERQVQEHTEISRCRCYTRCEQ